MNVTLQSDFILPPEWDRQSGIMLTWPHEHTDWKPYLQEITETFLQLADIITRHEKLIIATPEPEKVEKQLKDRLNEEQMKKVKCYAVDTDDTWARDHGPITLVSTGKAHVWQVPIHMLDFNFNGWGEKYPYDKDNRINLQLYYAGAFKAVLENHTDFTLEGGAIESDGKGSIFTTSMCMLAPHRNEPLTKKDIDERLRILFHAQRVVWIDHGHLIGDDTDGHIDTIVRLAPNDTLLYIEPGDKSDPQHDDFVKLEEQLKTLRTLDGKPYRLIPLPMPDAIYDGDDRLPATYANFLIINGAVIVPTYGQPEKDERAKEQIQKAFPGRTVIGVDARTVIRQHGSIHCLTMQLPKGAIRTHTNFNWAQGASIAQ
ncbi:agmatine deiminase family protein [Prevotella sp. AGR2160]|uniref:agmatine deiminase family protein n=1 Tax=Prevotella sp. AGR2160 TaxID=1280674 RepID=UPI000562A923|nr:agmatine deiminase family protein [Prevotella sp. AGR2160]